MIDVKFFDNYYVGFKKSREENLLGFATQVEGVDSKDKNRKDTVDRWRDKQIAPADLENVGTYGFKLLDVMNRYRGNKVFRILDPRGFELEISAYNLMDILGRCTIAKGTIADKMLWARNGAQNYLIPEDSPEYQYYKDAKDNVISTHVEGQWYTNKVKNIKYKYLGKFYRLSLDTNIRNVINYNSGYSSYYKRSDPLWSLNPHLTATIKQADRTVYGYMEEYTDYRNGENKTTYRFVSKLKYINELRMIEPPTEYDVGLELDEHIPTIYDLFFKTKEQMLNKLIDVDFIMKLIDYKPYNWPSDRSLQEINDHIKLNLAITDNRK